MEKRVCEFILLQVRCGLSAEHTNEQLLILALSSLIVNAAFIGYLQIRLNVKLLYYFLIDVDKYCSAI